MSIRTTTAVSVLLVLFITIPAAGDKLPLEFCQGIEFNMDVIINEIMEKDDLEQVKECMESHRDLFPRFMKYYQGDVPTLIVNPPLDNAAMTGLEIVQSDIPDYNSLRLAARSMGMFGDYYRLTGKPLKAARIYVTILKCGIDVEHGFGTIKSEISKMIAVAIQKLALRRLAYLFATRALEAGKERSIMKSVDKLLAQRVALVDIARIVKSSQAKYDVKQLAKEGVFGKLGWLEKVLYSSLGGRAGTHYHRMINEIFEDIEKAVQMDYPQGKTQLEQVQQKIMKIAGEANEPGFSIVVSPARQMAKVLISISVANWERIWNTAWQVPVTKDGLFIIHLLNEYHRKHGQYPEKLKMLSETSPAKIPRDVFTGKPFVYRRLGTTFVLYSRGADGADNKMDKNDDVIILGEHEDDVGSRINIESQESPSR